MLDLAIVRIDGGFHRVVARGVTKVGNDGDWAVRLHLSGHFGGIDHNLRVEDLLLNTFVEVVGHGADKHALRQVTDFRRRNQAVHLRVDRGRDVLPIDGDGLPFLQDFAEPFGERLGSFADNLPRKHIPDRVLNHPTFLFTVVARELREVLKTEAHGDLVTARRGDQVVESAEVDRRQLVDDNRTFELFLLIDQLHNAAVV